MNSLRYPLAILLFVLSLPSVFAQQAKVPGIGSVSGTLSDPKNNPVSYATLTLFKDSTVINGDLSKDDGSFKISGVGIGKYRLRIESIGVTTKWINSIDITADAPDKKLGKITVSSSDNTLQDVKITGEKAVMELKVDKKVFNVEQNTTTAGGSAADVLQNVPSVTVDPDGNVSLRGKSDVTILIDGKPSTLLGTDVASALESLPAGSIESVEVITNPSAKYDAQGSTGIINIITKKDGRFGINGNITLGAGTRDKYNGNLGLNVRKGKWNFFLNSSARLNSNYNHVTTTRYDKVPSVGGEYQNYYTYENVPRNFDGYFNSIGASFDPDKYNSITFTENINKMNFNFKDYSDYIVYNTPGYNTEVGAGSPSMTENKYTNQGGGPFSTSSSLDYKHKFKKKDEELSVDATYSNNTRSILQYYKTIALDTFGTPAYNNIIDNAPGTSTNSSVNVWADYTDPLFTQNGKLGLGFKSQLYWFNSTNNPIIDTPGVNNLPGVVDSSLISRYNYTQQIHAGYINWNDQVGRFGYQVGLRLEDDIYSGSGSFPRPITETYSFLDLFPSAFVSYKLNDQQSIFLNYSRRTDRPNFRQLLPYIDLSNPGTVSTGNPGLLPEFINNIEFSYSLADKKGNNIILSAYYAYTQNLIQTITVPTSAAPPAFQSFTGELYSAPINIASGTTYGAEATGHLQFTKFWDATANFNFFENQLLVGTANPSYAQYLSNTNGFTWFGKINTTLKLPANFSFQVNANYMSPQIVTEGTTKQTWWMDLALRKSFLKNKLMIVANCSDVFKTHQFITYYNLGTYNETVNRVKETRVGMLTATYRFGKTSAPKHPAKDTQPLAPTDEDRTKNLKGGDDDQGGGGNGAGSGGGNGGSRQ